MFTRIALVPQSRSTIPKPWAQPHAPEPQEEVIYPVPVPVPDSIPAHIPAPAPPSFTVPIPSPDLVSAPPSLTVPIPTHFSVPNPVTATVREAQGLIGAQGCQFNHRQNTTHPLCQSKKKAGHEGMVMVGSLDSSHRRQEPTISKKISSIFLLKCLDFWI